MVELPALTNGPQQMMNSEGLGDTVKQKLARRLKKDANVHVLCVRAPGA